jgi:hypothetical protein
MLFMVIERFKQGNSAAVGERFARCGRMLPAGLSYHASWIDTDGQRCFQLMEAADGESFRPWVRQWCDLIDFEIVPVLPSTEFWSKQR